MADFYAARDNTTPPLPWPSIAPPITESDEKTSGGLIIPDTAKEKPQEGEVVSVGAGAKDDAGARIAMDVKAGDKILFGKWSGTEIKIDSEELMIMKESDILGIMA